MPTKSTHRWEQIKEFVPGCRATGTSGQLKCVTSGSGNTSLPSACHVNTLKERDPNIRKAPKEVKTGYKPPVIVTGTPSIQLLPPPTPKIKPVSLADGDLTEIFLPPRYLSTYTEVEIITTRNVQSPDGTEHVLTSIETSFSISVQAEKSTTSTHTFGEGSKSSSAATPGTGTSSHTPGLEHHSDQVTKNKNQISLTTTQTRAQAAHRTGSLIIPAKNVLDAPLGSDHTPSTPDPTKPRSCQGGDATVGGSGKMKQGSNTVDNGTSVVQHILPTPGFNWADDALDEEEHQPRAMPLLLKGKGRQFNPNTSDQKYPAKRGPRWAEIITPVHFSHRGGPTTLILTTVGVGADSFSGWETVAGALTKKMLGVILEEPVHHGLHGIATKNAASKGVNAGTSTRIVEGVKASGELQNAEWVPATASKESECISSQCVSDGSGQQPAGGNAVMKEITDPPDNRLTLNYYENTSAFPLVLLLLWVSFILYPIAP